MQAHGPLRFWIVAESGMPKKGKHSVGVARQYCGEVGKVDNGLGQFRRQIAVTAV